MKNAKSGWRAGALMGAACMLAATSSWAQVHTVNLRAEEYVKSVALPDGGIRDVLMWGFALDGAAPTSPGPTLNVPVGTTALIVNLQNNLTVPVSIVIPNQNGFEPGPGHASFTDGTGRTRARSFVKETAPDTVVAYRWNNPTPGTYVYHSGSHTAFQTQMGLYGMLTMDAAAGSAYAGVPYAVQTQWIFSEIDLDVHDAVQAGTYDSTVKSMMQSRPEIYLLNGEPYRAAELSLTPGQARLIRMANTCFDERVPVLNGAHASVVAEDGRKYPYPKTEYALALPALKTRDAVLVPGAAGTIKMFDRRTVLGASVTSVGPTDTVPPVILSASATAATTVRVLFSEPVNASGGTFAIDNGVTVSGAAPGATPDTVVLTTSALGGGNYLLTVDNVTDLAATPNAIAAGSQFAFSYTVPDTTPPTLASVASLDATTVRVVYSERIEAPSPAHYSIDAGAFAVTGVTLSDPATVTLTTAALSAGLHTLAVAGARDLAGNPVAPGTQATFDVRGLTRVTAGLVALYGFNEGAGTTVFDVSGVGTPMDLTILNPARVTWLGGGVNGVRFATAGSAIQSTGAGTKVLTALKNSNALTIEAWVAPANLTQNDMRIVALALNKEDGGLDVHLAQAADSASCRLRTSVNNSQRLNGAGAFTAVDGLRHVVITYDAAGASPRKRMYVDGVQIATQTQTGDFSTWNVTYPFVLGNVPTLNKSWLGTMRLVAVYDRALSQAEIQQNTDAGPRLP